MRFQRPSAWRHTTLPLVLFALSAYFTCSEAIDCAPPPINLRVGNVTLSTGNVRRGVEASVGTPPQTLAFMPGWDTNNTYLYGTDGDCTIGSDWSTSACTTFRGGAYDAAASTSDKTASKDAYTPDARPFNQMEYVSDTLKLSDDVSLEGFTMGVALNDLDTQGYYPTMTFGVGTASTLLNTLKSSGKIASRTFSFFAGRFGAVAAAQSDGGMVFGGYDKAKVTGQKYTYPLTRGTGCGTDMVVVISDIQLNFPNGTNASLFEGSQSESITACLKPSLPVFMNIPLKPYFERWLAMTDKNVDIFTLQRSTGINFWNMRYPAGITPYPGDVTIKLVSGLTVRLPNNQLIVPETSIDPNTGAIVANSTGPDFLVNSMQDVNARDMASLGTTFLSLAYLMVNQDANQFTLWAANPTTHSSDLVAVDEDGADVTATCTATSSATADSTSSSTSSNDDDESPSPSASGDGTSSDAGESTSTGRAATEATTAPTLSKGGIAGVVVGGVAAVALMGAAAFWLLRRKRAAAAAAAVPAVWDQHHPTSEMYVPPKYTHEIEGTPYSAEMPANPAMYNPPGVRYEMA